MQHRLNPARLALAAVCLAACALAPMQAGAADAPEERVQVADAFIELHTGPGRGYPVFYVAAREEWISIESRHTDWFKVRTTGGKQGWVPREQLERTLTAAGGAKTFRDVALDDYLRRRVEFGAAWGHFSAEPMLKAWTAYRMSDTLSLEATLGQVQGRYAGTDFWHVNINAEPWSDQRVSPFFGIGVGKFRNVPNTSLVGAVTTSANLANAAIGVRYHISDRFVARADYSIYTALIADTNSSEYRAFSLGIAFFF